MSTESGDREEAAHQEARRLISVLLELARLLGYSNREVERRADLNHTMALKYFQGHVEPKLGTFLELVKAVGLDFAEFFELAYAESSAPPTAARQKLHRLLESTALPPQKAGEGPLPRAEIEKMLEDLRREVRDLIQQQARPARKAADHDSYSSESGKPPRTARKTS